MSHEKYFDIVQKLKMVSINVTNFFPNGAPYIFTIKLVKGNFPMLCCCKDYKNITRDKKFLRSRFFVWFLGFVSFILKYKFFKLVASGFHFPLCKKLYKSVFFFHFLRLESYLLKYKKFFRVSVSGNIRIFPGVFVSKNMRKAFSWKNIRSFLRKEL